MIPTEHAIALVAVVALVTAGIRFLPFVLFAGRRTPRAVSYLGGVLPAAIMGMLVVYCLKDLSFAAVSRFLPQLLAGAVVVVSYLWKKNTLLSIIGGTACYMVLVQTVFR